jgi:hypothetical protein
MPTMGCCWYNVIAESFSSSFKHEVDLDDQAVILNNPSS